MVPTTGLVVPAALDPSALIAYAQRAESLGFDELWVIEDCFLNGGIAQATAILARTSRITVGLGILPAGARNVAFATLDLATIANLFPGRLIIGIGHGMPGWMRQVGAWPASPLTLLAEYLQAVRGLLSGNTVTLHGRHVELDDVALSFPPQQVPPILAGVRGEKSLELAGQHADGTILAEPVTPEYLEFVKAHTGNNPDHRIVAYNAAAVDEDADVARQQVRHTLSWVGDADWQPHIAALPFAADLAQLRAGVGSRAEFADKLPAEWVDQLAIVGTPEMARNRVAELRAAGVHSIVLSPAGPDWLAAMESLAALR